MGEKKHQEAATRIRWVTQSVSRLQNKVLCGDFDLDEMAASRFNQPDRVG